MPTKSPTHLLDNIELIAKHEQEFLSQRTRAERISDTIAGFIGSFTFVIAHLLAFGFWIIWNNSKHTHHFDPRPFGLLQTIVAMEAILAASFILIRQSRIGRRSDERDHLMLQILILTEKEITAALEMERHIAIEMGLQHRANTPEAQALSRPTSIDDVAQNIKDSLPNQNF